MSSFKIEKRVGVRDSADRIWEVIADLSSWDRWNPIETQVDGRIAFGGTVTLTETVPGLPERRVSLAVGEWQPEAQLILSEKRGWLFNVVRYYEIEQLDVRSSIVSNGYLFSGFRGEGFHDKHRRALRAACEAVGEGLRAEIERAAEGR